MSCLHSYSGHLFLQCSAQKHHLQSIVISHDGFGQFEQLIINYTQLISPNAEQKLCHQNWCMTRLTQQSSTHRVIIAYPPFFAGYDMMQENISFSAIEAAVYSWQDAVGCLFTSTYMAPNFFGFESFLILSNITKLLCDQLLMILQVQIAPDLSLHEVMPRILCLQTFSLPSTSKS